MPPPVPAEPGAIATVLLTALIAVAGALAPAAVLHVALAHAMRARGLARWRPVDTLLVSPLLALGLFVAFGSLAHGLSRAAVDAVTGRPGQTHLAGTLAVAAGAFVVAGFGARAIGKLY